MRVASPLVALTFVGIAAAAAFPDIVGRNSSAAPNGSGPHHVSASGARSPSRSPQPFPPASSTAIIIPPFQSPSSGSPVQTLPSVPSTAITVPPIDVISPSGAHSLSGSPTQSLSSASSNIVPPHQPATRSGARSASGSPAHRSGFSNHSAPGAGRPFADTHFHSRSVSSTPSASGGPHPRPIHNSPNGGSHVTVQNYESGAPTPSYLSHVIAIPKPTTSAA